MVKILWLAWKEGTLQDAEKCQEVLHTCIRGELEMRNRTPHPDSQCSFSSLSALIEAEVEGSHWESMETPRALRAAVECKLLSSQPMGVCRLLWGTMLAFVVNPYRVSPRGHTRTHFTTSQLDQFLLEPSHFSWISAFHLHMSCKLHVYIYMYIDFKKTFWRKSLLHHMHGMDMKKPFSHVCLSYLGLGKHVFEL